MTGLDWILSIATLVVALLVTIVVMMQNAKSSSSSVTGSNTFYGANKSKTNDALLSKLTVVLSLIFIGLCFATAISLMS